MTVVAGALQDRPAHNRLDALSVRLGRPVDVAVDGAGRLFIAELGGERVRVVTSAGTIENATEAPGPKGSPMKPWGVALDRSGRLYVSDASNHRIWRMSGSRLEPIAGSGDPGFAGDGGRAISARLREPRDIEVDGAGNIYIADWGNRRVRKISGSGDIVTIAGTGQPGSFGDFGPAVEASVEPHGLGVGPDGTVYIAEPQQNRVRAVRGDGVIIPIAGTGEPGFAGDGDPSTEAVFNGPADVAVDEVSTLYISDSGNGRIRSVRNAIVSTVAGRGFASRDTPESATLVPLGLAASGAGELYFADANPRSSTLRHRVWRLLDPT